MCSNLKTFRFAFFFLILTLLFGFIVDVAKCQPRGRQYNKHLAMIFSRSNDIELIPNFDDDEQIKFRQWKSNKAANKWRRTFSGFKTSPYKSQETNYI